MQLYVFRHTQLSLWQQWYLEQRVTDCLANRLWLPDLQLEFARCPAHQQHSHATCYYVLLFTVCCRL
jgi:hypothetical protein